MANLFFSEKEKGCFEPSTYCCILTSNFSFLEVSGVLSLERKPDLGRSRSIQISPYLFFYSKRIYKKGEVSASFG
jgi:hypothetical protein